MNLLFRDESFAINGAAFEVYNYLHSGFSEYVYQDALEEEFKLRGIPYEREKEITVTYKGKELKHRYIADFLCYGEIIVELKAVSEISTAHCAQVGNYLKATHKKLGLILNFGDASRLQCKRIVN